MKLFLFAGLSISLFLMGCNSNTDSGGGGQPVVQATYASLNANVIQPKCTGCHGEGSKHGSLTTYDDVKAMVNGTGDKNLIQRITTADATKRMPKNNPALSSTDVSAFQTWANNGAPND